MMENNTDMQGRDESSKMEDLRGGLRESGYRVESQRIITGSSSKKCGLESTAAFDKDNGDANIDDEDAGTDSVARRAGEKKTYDGKKISAEPYTLQAEPLIAASSQIDNGRIAPSGAMGQKRMVGHNGGKKRARCLQVPTDRTKEATHGPAAAAAKTATITNAEDTFDVTLLYTDNIMKAVSETNEMASGLSTGGSTICRQMPHVRNFAPLLTSTGLLNQTRALEIINDLQMQNSELRQRNEALTQELGAFKMQISQLLSGLGVIPGPLLQQQLPQNPNQHKDLAQGTCFLMKNQEASPKTSNEGVVASVLMSHYQQHGESSPSYQFLQQDNHLSQSQQQQQVPPSTFHNQQQILQQNRVQQQQRQQQQPSAVMSLGDPSNLTAQSQQQWPQQQEQLHDANQLQRFLN
jgi:hypothetical protein